MNILVTFALIFASFTCWLIFSSPIEPVYYLLPLVGLIIGFFGTIIGGGGGFFFLPVLILIVGAPMHTAVITSLVAALPVSAAGGMAYYRRGYVDMSKGMVFIVAGIVGAFAGTYLGAALSERPLKMAFGIYAVLIAVHLAWITSKNEPVTKAVTDRRSSSNRVDGNYKVRGSFFGFFAGVITGSFGTSGTAPVLVGLFSMNLATKVVIGTSLLVAFTNTFFAVGAHFLVGSIDLTLVGFLTAGSLIGALVGPRVLSNMGAKHTDNPGVRYTYALVMVIIGVLMIIA